MMHLSLSTTAVIPAQAGTQPEQTNVASRHSFVRWAPACAGVTVFA
jgi:hypothetical protein